MLKEMNGDDPEELLEQSRRGSTQAFAGIVRQYQSCVRAYLARYVRDQDAVEDLAQDVPARLSEPPELPRRAPGTKKTVFFVPANRNEIDGLFCSGGCATY